MTKFFKIIWGYEAEDYTEIDETEVEKAEYAHLTKKDAIYSGGSVSGSRIIAVAEDYHRAMGWNRGYKLGALDYEELKEKGIDREYRKFLAEKKDKVHYLIETKQEHLIGKNIAIPELEKPQHNEISEAAKQLSGKLKV